MNKREMGMSGVEGAKLRIPSFFTLRFRGKVMAGFAAVLLISTVSLGIAYLGFERVSAAIAGYRNSVAEADVARNIDRELISYRALVKYYVITGKEEDAQAAQAAEAGLKAAIDDALHRPADQARRQGLSALAADFKNFSGTFADILKLKQESTQITQNQLVRDGNMLRYKLDDIAGNASGDELAAVELGVKQVITQLQAATALANNFAVNADQSVATSAQARLKFVENALNAVAESNNEKIAAGLKEAKGLLGDYRQALAKLAENAKTISSLVVEMSGAAEAIVQRIAHQPSGAALDRRYGNVGKAACNSTAAATRVHRGKAASRQRERSRDRDGEGGQTLHATMFTSRSGTTITLRTCAPSSER